MSPTIEQVTPEQSANSIPIIDIGNLFTIPVSELNYGNKKIQEIAKGFGTALHEHGFVYLTNHGIPENTISEAFRESKKFFELPTEIKMKYAKGDIEKSNHGYMHLGREMLNADSFKEWKEHFDIFNPDRFYPTEEAPCFQGVLEGLENACRLLDTKLVRLLAMAVGLEDVDFFYKCSANLENRNVPSGTVYRTLFYPPPIAEEITSEECSRMVGCGEHTDWGILTLLFQDSVGGLEVKSTKNEWVKAKPIPNTIIVNTGDLLEAWTGGYFPATPHRVRVENSSPSKKGCGASLSEGCTRQARQSIAFFLQPDDDVMISPLKSEVISEPYHLEPLSAREHFARRVREANGRY